MRNDLTLLLVTVLILMVGCAGDEEVLVPTQPPTTIELVEVTESPTKTAVPTAVPQSTPNSTEADELMGVANADVTFVRVVQTGVETWTFHVTVAHPDTGWEDYADGWDVVLPDGTAVKPTADSPFTRLLLHPHETEQPFTRSQSGIVIPAAITEVTVRAHDLVDGFGGQEIIVDLTAVSGPDFAVEK